MTDPNKQDNGVEQTSRLKRNPAGIFTNLIRNEIRSVPSQSSQSADTAMEKASITNLEQIELRSRLLGRIDSVLLIAPHVEKSLTGTFLNRIIEALEKINEIKSEVESSSTLSNDIEKRLNNEMDAISEIIERSDTKNKNERLENMDELLVVAGEYKKNLAHYEDVINELRGNNSPLLASKGSILSAIDELAWLHDDPTVIHKSNTGVTAVDVREKVNKLARDLENISVLVDNLDTVEDLEQLVKEADKLHVNDKILSSLRTSFKERAVFAISRFSEKQNVKNFTALDNLRSEYSDLIGKMKLVVVPDIPLPRVLSGPQQIEPEVSVQSSTEPTNADPKQSSGRAPGDIVLPRITRNRQSRNSQTKYKIKKEDGSWEIVPRVFWGTLNRFEFIFGNEEYKDKDFSNAVALKEELLEAIDVVDFDLADKKAQALGAELDIIESKKSPDVPPTKPPTSGDGSPEVEAVVERATFKDIMYDVPTRKTEQGVLQVKIGDEYKDLPKIVTPILYKYLRTINNPEHKDKDFTQSTTLKDAVRKNINNGDFSLAEKNAKKLSAELSIILGVEPVVKTKINNPPIGQLVSLLTRKREAPEDVERRAATGKTTREEVYADLLAWKKKWLDSGEIDAYREKYGKMPVSDEQLATSKLLLEAYIEILGLDEKAKIDENFVRSVNNQCSIYAKILTGIHNETASDIKFLVENYDQGADLTLLQRLRSSISRSESGQVAKVTRTNPLRPRLAGSPKSEQISINTDFELQKTVFRNANSLLEKMVPLLSSEDEQKAFLRLRDELIRQQDVTASNPTKESVALFTAKVERLVAELSKKSGYITAQFGEDLPDATSATISSSANVIRSKRLRGTAEKKEKIGGWQARQDLQGSAEDLQKTAEEKYKQELAKKHEEMFARDPVMYKHLYGKENIARDAKTIDVAAKTLEGKSPLTPKEHLLELTAEMEQLQAQWKKLHEDIAHGTAFGNPEGEKRVLQAKIELLNEKIQTYRNIVLQEITNPGKKYSSLETGKQVYNPSLDPSLNDKTRGEYTQNKDGTVRPLDRTTLTQEELTQRVKELGYTKDAQGNVIPVDFSEMSTEEIKAHSNALGKLNESIHPNHFKGMVSTLTESEANKLTDANFQPEKPFATDTPENTHALYNKDYQTMRENLPATPEVKQKRHTLVNKVSSWLFGYPSAKKFKWGYLAAGITSFAVASGAFASEEKQDLGNPQRTGGPRTLADMIREKPDLEKALSGKIPDAYLSTVINRKLESEEAFKQLLKVRAPQFNINPSNPTIGTKIKDLKCKMVYDVEGAGEGITEDQQQEASEIIKNLQKILIYIKTNDESALFSRDVRLFTDEDTIFTFYEKVRSAISGYNTERDKLKKV